MTQAVRLDRTQVLAYRAWAQGLHSTHRDAPDPATSRTNTTAAHDTSTAQGAAGSRGAAGNQSAGNQSAAGDQGTAGADATIAARGAARGTAAAESRGTETTEDGGAGQDAAGAAGREVAGAGGRDTAGRDVGDAAACTGGRDTTGRDMGGTAVRVPDTVAGLEVLAVGLQDTPAGAATLALRHRTSQAVPLDQPDLVLALTIRGSPHLHRRLDLPMLRAALRPRDNEMLRAYLGGFGDTLLRSGADGPALLARVADEMRATFPGEVVTKGELSSAVSPGLPDIVRPWCERCGTAHVADGMFRLATLYAGIELVPGEDRRLRFLLAPGEPAIAGGTATELLRTAVRLAGPLTLNDLAQWLDTRSVTAPPDWLRRVWSDLADDLVTVDVDGATLHAPRDMVDALGDAPAAPPPPVLLLPPRDTYLLGHRSFLVPDRALATEVWRPVGSPGVLVVDGEVAGTWRARKAGRRLELTVSTVRALKPGHRAALDAQAELVAAARGHAGTVTVG